MGTESASLEKYIFNHRYREIRNGQRSRKISGEKEAEFERFYEDLQDLLELTPKKDLFH